MTQNFKWYYFKRLVKRVKKKKKKKKKLVDKFVLQFVVLFSIWKGCFTLFFPCVRNGIDETVEGTKRDFEIIKDALKGSWMKILNDSNETSRWSHIHHWAT